MRADGILELWRVCRVGQHGAEHVHVFSTEVLDGTEDFFRVGARGEVRIVVEHEVQQVRDGWRHRKCRRVGSRVSSWTQLRSSRGEGRRARVIV